MCFCNNWLKGVCKLIWVKDGVVMKYKVNNRYCMVSLLCIVFIILFFMLSMKFFNVGK